jgi:hypothetical protein
LESRNARQQRGYQLAENYEIQLIRENIWLVPSQSGNGAYEVTKSDGVFVCTCKDFEYRSAEVGLCKHCFALDYYLRLKVKVLSDVETQIEESAPAEIILCPDCKSPSVMNYGKRGKRVLKQIFCCKDCGRQFRKQEEVYAKLQTLHCLEYWMYSLVVMLRISVFLECSNMEIYI